MEDSRKSSVGFSHKFEWFWTSLIFQLVDFRFFFYLKLSSKFVYPSKSPQLKLPTNCHFLNSPKPKTFYRHLNRWISIPSPVDLYIPWNIPAIDRFSMWKRFKNSITFREWFFFSLPSHVCVLQTLLVFFAAFLVFFLFAIDNAEKRQILGISAGCKLIK